MIFISRWRSIQQLARRIFKVIRVHRPLDKNFDLLVELKEKSEDHLSQHDLLSVVEKSWKIIKL